MIKIDAAAIRKAYPNAIPASKRAKQGRKPYCVGGAFLLYLRRIYRRSFPNSFPNSFPSTSELAAALREFGPELPELSDNMKPSERKLALAEIERLFELSHAAAERLTMLNDAGDIEEAWQALDGCLK